jgi:endonuclease YncB( thermonuclease family)
MLPPRWRRHPIVLAVVLVLLVVAMLDRSGRLRSRGDDNGRYHNQTFRIVHVVDGDTFDVDAPDGPHPRTRIRLWGVDTPEVRHGQNGADMYYGPEAAAYARDILMDKKVKIELVVGKPRDKYNRLLAYVFLTDSGEMFNERLLKTGHAYADPRFDHPWKQRFTDIENRARRDQAGLWREVRPEQYPAWKKRSDHR